MGPAADGYFFFLFLAIDEDDLVVTDFVDGILAEFTTEGDCFGSGAGDSKSGFGVVFALAGDWE